MQQLATSFDLVLKIFLRSRMVLQFSHLTCIKLYGLSMAYNVSVATSCITPVQNKCIGDDTKAAAGPSLG